MPVPVGIAIGCASNQKLIAGRARPARAKAPITVNRNIKISRNAPTLSYGKLLVGSRPEINGSVVPSASFFQSLTGTLRNPAKANVGGKVAFVAGATGRAGARVVRELLKAGYKVRAGARDVEAAQRAVDVAEAYGLLTADQIKRLEIVPFNLADAESIRSAIGGARKVVCAVGAPESEAFNFSAPKKIDGEGTTRLIKEAASAGVEQFVMISSLGTGKIGFPASILNLFWGVLSYKREAEKALETSGMNYTIVRPGGMERPPDSYKKTHNVVLSPADTKFGGQVSRLQVAELVSSVLNSPGLASNRILEVTAETTAPRASYSELLQAFAAGAAPAVPKPAGRAPAAASKAAPAAAPAAAAGAAKGGKPERAGLAQRVTAAKEEQSSVKKSTAPVMEAAAQAEEALEQARKELQQAGVSEAVAKRVLEEAKAAAAKGPLSSRDIQQLKQKAAAVEKSAPKPAAAAPKAAAQVEKAVEKAPQPTNIFSRLFGLDKAVTVDEGEKISVPKKDGEEEEAPPARAPAPPAAAPKVQPAPATPKPAAAAPQPKPAAAAPPPPPPVARGPPVPVEDAAEVERRALAAVAEERKAKALAEAKKQLEAEAQAIAETKALAENIASQKASEAPAPKAAPKAAPKVEAKAAPKAEAKAAPKAEAKAAPKAAPKVEAKAAPAAEPKAEAKPAAPVDNAQVAMNKKAAQEWIAKWQAKQQAPPGTAQSNGGTSGGPEAPDVQQNKKAAQQWIENWRSKQTVK